MPFSADSLRFLRRLAKNNNKPWFEAHREKFESTIRDPMRELIESLDARFTKFAPEIGGDPKRSMFRIHRDIRFSKDKSPYKTHTACWFHHRSAASTVGSEADTCSAGFYFHFEPGRSMVGAGIWMPPRPQLNRLRDAIACLARRYANALARRRHLNGDEPGCRPKATDPPAGLRERARVCNGAALSAERTHEFLLL